MNYLIFMLAIAMCFGLNEGIVWICLMNTLEFQNKLNPLIKVVFSKLIAHPTEMKLMIFTR
ncbi:unnamed protein product [Brassica rapa subsp. trilocularis]